jgi:class 3 adenylate cyclase/tetratricopeptide (TPR) repeat protein
MTTGRQKKSGRFRAGLRPTIMLGAGLCCLLAVLMAAGLFNDMENKALDKAFNKRPPIKTSPDIITLDIDDQSIGVVGRWPWPWSVHAMVLDFLTLYGAGSVTFVDLDFSREYELHLSGGEEAAFRDRLLDTASSFDGKGSAALPDYNKTLFESIKKNGRALFSFDFKLPVTVKESGSPLKSAGEKSRLFTKEKLGNIGLLRKRSALPLPSGPYLEAVDVEPPLAGIMENAAGAGFNTILLDSDGVVRRYPLIASYNGDIYPSIALRTLMSVLKADRVSIIDSGRMELRGQGGVTTIPVNRQGEMYINWAGSYTDTFTHVPFNLAASFMALQTAKDALAGYSLNTLADPMALQGIVTGKLRETHVFSEEQCGATGTIAFVAYLIEYYLRNTQYTVEDILTSLGVDTGDDFWLTLGREIALNNALVGHSAGDGKIPSFEALIKEAGYVLNDNTTAGLRSSYGQTAYFIARGMVDRVRPLYFGPGLRLTIGKKELVMNPLTFRDKAVFYGLTATGLTAQHTTPFMERHPMLDLVPNVVNTVITDNKLFSMRHYVIGFMYLLAVLFAVMYLSPVRGLMVACIAGLLHASLCWFAFTTAGYILPVTPPFFSIIVSYGSTLVYRYFQEQKEKRKVRGMFSTMVSPEVLKIMEANPAGFRLAGEQREATIFSSDVSGFTTISEGVTARELANILNIYLTPMSNIIMSYNGYVDKYEGDAIKADFGVPLSDPDHAWKACLSALHQQAELKVIQRMILLRYGVRITARMGINTGMVSAGNMGSEKRMQYTVMGETVTLAEELEPANKLFETWIAIGPETFERSRDYVEVRYLNNLIMGPAGTSVPVHELAGWKKDKYLEYWTGKPVPELALQSLGKMLPEKVIAYHEFYNTAKLSPSPLLEDMRKLFGELKEKAIEYMKANNEASVLYVREQLAGLRADLDAHKDLYGMRPEEASAHGQSGAWKEIVLNWRAELRECAGIQKLLKGKIPREENDNYFAVIDILEKNVECIYKRITFPSSDDTTALEMADHLKGLLLSVSASPGPSGAPALEGKANTIKDKIDERLTAFADSLKERADEYHMLLSDFCLLSEDKRKAMEIFKRGHEHYLLREWDKAVSAFREALDIVPDDGPSIMFIKKIGELKKDPPSSDWDGAWEEG